MEGPADRSSMRALTGPVLAVQGKKGSDVDLVKPVKRYLARIYSEAEACADDLEAVQRLREAVVRGKEGALKARNDLEKYYRILKVMETRFPFSDDKEQIDSVFFVWKDAFKTKDKTALRSIKAEQAAILFNLGATISQQAIETDRDSENGIKLACKYFQEAAGVFALVRQTGVAKIPAAGKDLSNESSTMLENLMLAQAQECFFVKATVDGSIQNG
eukprot:jgi/Pico_ML_1/51255/g2317.t1